MLLRCAVAATLLWAPAAARATGEHEDSDSVLEGLVQLLLDVDEPAVELDLLRGLREGLEGRRDVLAPASWAKARVKLRSSESVDVREEATRLALLFGDEDAQKELRKTLLDGEAPPALRNRALRSLVDARVPGLGADLRGLLAATALRAPALRALATYADAETPAAILAIYASLPDAEKGDAISTLASRRSYASALLAAVAEGRVPVRDLSSVTARQLRAFGDAELDARLDALWGKVRTSSEERRQLIQQYEKLLTPDLLRSADLTSGRKTFRRVCGSCHKMFGDGGDVGPELTGSDRRKLLYVLENVLDPNAVVANAYRMVTVVTAQGRVVSGIVRESNEQRLLLQTTNERLTIPSDDVLSTEVSSMSIMPEGLLHDLTPEEVRDLVGYLASDQQVALPDDE